jgi:uncharacterized protein (DUF924 family)
VVRQGHGLRRSPARALRYTTAVRGCRFFYLPFEHAEDLVAQERCCTLFAEDAEALKYAEAHRDIIARFGRFPHRNAALGRTSTPEEMVFLAGPNSSF